MLGQILVYSENTLKSQYDINFYMPKLYWEKIKHRWRIAMISTVNEKTLKKTGEATNVQVSSIYSYYNVNGVLNINIIFI